MTEQSPRSSAADRRARAAAVRKAGAGSERRSRFVFAAALTLAVAAIGGGTWYGVATQQQVNRAVAPQAVTGTDAIGVGSADAPVVVDAYEDFYCGACDTFEGALAGQLADRIEDGRVRVNYHMMSFVRPDASEDADAASACAADGGKFTEFHEAFYATSTGEQTATLGRGDLVELGRGVGLGGAAFERCVTDGTYRPYADRVDVSAAKKGVNSTPTFFVDGQQVPQGDPAALLTAIDTAARDHAGSNDDAASDADAGSGD